MYIATLWLSHICIIACKHLIFFLLITMAQDCDRSKTKQFQHHCLTIHHPPPLHKVRKKTYLLTNWRNCLKKKLWLLDTSEQFWFNEQLDQKKGLKMEHHKPFHNDFLYDGINKKWNIKKLMWQVVFYPHCLLFHHVEVTWCQTPSMRMRMSLKHFLFPEVMFWFPEV